jgi:hypothetical protein
VGVQAITPLLPGRLNLAIGAASWGIQDKMDIAGTQFWGKARVGAVPLVLAWYPFGNGFNLQGGVFFNFNRLSVLCMVPTGGTVRIAHHTYTAAELGTVSGASKFNLVAPYLGIGFGQPFRGGKFGFTASLGAFYAWPRTRTPSTITPQWRISTRWLVLGWFIGFRKNGRFFEP